MPLMNRRAVLAAGLTWGGVTLLGPIAALARQLVAAGCDERPIGELLGHIPLHGDRPRPTAYGTLVGGPGLDARLFTDLSALRPDRLVTPSAEVFVRTAASPQLPAGPWTIAARGFADADAHVTSDALARDARPMGVHLIECSGNANPDNFGLMSAAEWDGVPIAPLLRALGMPASGPSVLVSGFDDTTTPSQTSNAGASWVFPLEALERTGAFLAVRMNGEPLTPDHGAPVRLVVPGWYGCSWIKWVNELRVVGADEPTTLQMKEFSLRTHQGSIPTLARNYEPPIIDLAATPIRVEKRRVAGRLQYRIIGIVWGGDRAVDRLAIRFAAGEQPRPFTLCPSPQTHRTWSLWDYRWEPRSPGLYTIALTAVDSSIRTRRLDVSYYVRRVVIDEVE
jgi:DMSO/TMAO reductase YedYZ molybdopterin-dependent catalytic subunit